jgi:hypothetical protein
MKKQINPNVKATGRRGKKIVKKNGLTCLGVVRLALHPSNNATL